MGYAASVPGAEPLESVSEDNPIRLNREQVVERIMSLNATATEDYLGKFADHDLRDYLRHLQVAQDPRGAAWSRPGRTPAIVSRCAGP